MTKTYFGIAKVLSDDNKFVECLLQKGTGNTIETSELVSEWFEYSEMKHVITNEICKERGIKYNLIMPQQFFKVEIAEVDGKIINKFYEQEETEELNDLFTKPDYFEGHDFSAFFMED